MFTALLYFFLIYMAYQFIFKFLIPVYRTTKHIRKGVRDMNDRMHKSSNTQQNSSSSQNDQPKKSSGKPVGDYIDFEEIK